MRKLPIIIKCNLHHLVNKKSFRGPPHMCAHMNAEDLGMKEGLSFTGVRSERPC